MQALAFAANARSPNCAVEAHSRTWERKPGWRVDRSVRLAMQISKWKSGWPPTAQPDYPSWIWQHSWQQTLPAMPVLPVIPADKCLLVSNLQVDRTMAWKRWLNHESRHLAAHSWKRAFLPVTSFQEILRADARSSLGRAPDDPICEVMSNNQLLNGGVQVVYK